MLIWLVTSADDVKLHEEDVMTEFASTLPIPQERVLLQELNHRISNEFFSAMSLVSLVAARSSSDEVKGALIGVTELLRRGASGSAESARRCSH